MGGLQQRGGLKCVAGSQALVHYPDPGRPQLGSPAVAHSRSALNELRPEGPASLSRGPALSHSPPFSAALSRGPALSHSPLPSPPAS
jgi:hypothetical protein